MAGFLVLAIGPAILGVVVGALTGGRLSELVGRFQALWLMWLASGVQALQMYSAPARQLVEHRLGIPMLAIIVGIGIAWLVLNIKRWTATMRLAGVLALVGACANGIAIAANGRMPYAQDAAATVGVPIGATTPKNEPVTSDSRFTFLGDILPIPGLDKIVSVGDILISVAVVLLLAAGMQHAHRRREVTYAPHQGSHPSGPRGVLHRDTDNVAVHAGRAVGCPLANSSQ